eukprot:scaffold6658_cov59-Isochrysis_galbana.AAC.1
MLRGRALSAPHSSSTRPYPTRPPSCLQRRPWFCSWDVAHLVDGRADGRISSALVKQLPHPTLGGACAARRGGRPHTKDGVDGLQSDQDDQNESNHVVGVGEVGSLVHLGNADAHADDGQEQAEHLHRKGRGGQEGSEVSRETVPEGGAAGRARSKPGVKEAVAVPFRGRRWGSRGRAGLSIDARPMTRHRRWTSVAWSGDRSPRAQASVGMPGGVGVIRRPRRTRATATARAWKPM